jgi:hypothetical protein
MSFFPSSMFVELAVLVFEPAEDGNFGKEPREFPNSRSTRERARMLTNVPEFNFHHLHISQRPNISSKRRNDSELH